MQRKIQFRGKRVDNGKMVFGDHLTGVGGKEGKNYIMPIQHHIPSDCHYLDGYEVHPETVGQYIGKSTNNAEVWEDGIYKNIHGNLVRVWINEDWQVLIGDVNKLSDSYYTPQYLEPVGNVFDNPELLK